MNAKARRAITNQQQQHREPNLDLPGSESTADTDVARLARELAALRAGFDQQQSAALGSAATTARP